MEKRVLPGFHRVHGLILIAVAAITCTAWYISRDLEEEKRVRQFQIEKEQLITLVKERMSRYEDALRSGGAAIHSQGHDINLFGWKRFARSLDLKSRYKGINGIGVVYHIRPQELEAYLLKMRADRPNYYIHPKHDSDEHWPITYIEPVSINKEAVGLDLAFEKNRLRAAKIARNTGETQITGPIVLVQDEEKTPGFLQFVPMYTRDNLKNELDRRKHFVGHVYAPFIMSNLIEGVLDKNNRTLIFSIYDDGMKLYDEIKTVSEEGNAHNPIFYDETDVPMYGRIWTFKVQANSQFYATTVSYQSLIILVGGGIIDTLLLVVFIFVLRSRRKAALLAEDVTKQLANREKFYHHVIEASPCAMIMADHSGEIKLVNNQAHKLFGYSIKELVGMNVDILVPREYRDVHGKHREAFSKRPTTRRMGLGREIFCLQKSGKKFPAEIGLSQFTSDNTAYVLATVVDISAQVKVNEELKQSNKELSDFAYVASHDLKAPLRGIIQLSHWIEEDIEGFIGADTQRNFDLLKNRTVRLDKLLDDLLAYSRIGRKESTLSEVDSKVLVRDVFDLFNRASDFELILEGEFPVFMTFAAPLEQVFRNLLGNALKHHDKQSGRILIAAEKRDDRIVFSVSDDGPGIAPEHQHKIFEIFQTLRPRDEIEGSGMGLAIVKKILDQFDSSISIESDGNEGSCFIFSWPIHA